MSDEEIFYQISIKVLLKNISGFLRDLDDGLFTFGQLRTISDPIQVSEFYEDSEGFKYQFIFMFSPNFLATNFAFGGIDPNVKWRFSIPHYSSLNDFSTNDGISESENIRNWIKSGVIEIISGHYPFLDPQALLNYS